MICALCRGGRRRAVPLALTPTVSCDGQGSRAQSTRTVLAKWNNVPLIQPMTRTRFNYFPKAVLDNAQILVY